MTTWVWVDGELSPADEARVGATDRGLLLGDGVYETCKVVGGTPFALTRHLARLHRSAAIVGLELPVDDDGLRRACAATLRAAAEGGSDEGSGGVGRLRITVTAGAGPLGPGRSGGAPVLIVTAGPGRRWAATADVATVPWRLNEHAPTVGAKTIAALDLVLALDRAHRAGADEAVLTNSAGSLCEGTASNVFLVVDDVLCTPALATGCLPGVTRELVCEALAADGLVVDERDDLTLDDLRRAPEAFLTSSTRDVHPIARVDRERQAHAPGALTTRAMAAWRSTVERTLDP